MRAGQPTKATDMRTEGITVLGRAAVAAVVLGASALFGGAPAIASSATLSAIETVPQFWPAVDTVYGDPTYAAQFWQQQTLPDSCGLMAVADVAGQLTGQIYSEDYVVSVAGNTPSGVISGPVYLPSQNDQPWGTYAADLVRVLSQFGIASYATAADQGADIDNLAASLERGQRVIAQVNGPMIDGMAGNFTTANHFVVVTGVDFTNGVVYVNDSWISGGAGLAVPLQTFVAAWATGNNTMVVTA